MAGTRARPPKMPTYCSWRSIGRVNDVLKQAYALSGKVLVTPVHADE